VTKYSRPQLAFWQAGAIFVCMNLTLLRLLLERTNDVAIVLKLWLDFHSGLPPHFPSALRRWDDAQRELLGDVILAAHPALADDNLDKILPPRLQGIRSLIREESLFKDPAADTITLLWLERQIKEHPENTKLLEKKDSIIKHWTKVRL